MTVDVRAMDDSIQARGLLLLGTGIMTDFFKGGGNNRGSEGLIKYGCKQTSKLISTEPHNAASNPIGPDCFSDVHSL